MLATHAETHPMDIMPNHFSDGSEGSLTSLNSSSGSSSNLSIASVPAAYSVFEIDFPTRSSTFPSQDKSIAEARRRALKARQSSTASYESAIIGEAHGLITDMLADSSLPPHVVSGLRSVSNLLKPQDSHGQMHKPKVSPLVSLTESGQYGSDSEDLPYTGERPSSLPKRFRRSLPPSLMRRMSTSTWTTTTSATGLPTLEPEVCRTRSSSFRHSRENTPGSSPTNSRSNSPSPSSPTTISLMIPKSRSFSATVGPVPAKRNSRERRSGTQTAPDSNLLSPIKPDKVKGLPRSSEADTTDIKVTTPTGKETYPSLSKRLNITSDYESSDSPGSSDHSDNVASVDESSATGSKCRDKSTSPLRPQKLVDTTDGKPELVKTSDSLLISSSSSPSSSAAAQPAAKPEQAASLPRVAEPPSSKPAQQGSHKDNLSQITAELESRAAEAAVETDDDGEIILPYSLEEIENTEQLHISRLSEWDYSIFDLADKAQDRILSQVAYKIFTEVGLFETFRIPLPQFLSYFHSLELGYREKPYHNRVHATDVLHGVYYLSTQPIPGFPQVNPEGDMFQKHISSSESDSETSEKCVPLRSFTAEDTYGIMGGNLPPLELMALYTAAAMHDYDHPGRTNAFLVTTNSPLAILYNDRSVLESHHAASAWRLFLSNHNYNWLSGLDKAEFKRFRFLVIEAVLATDLKRHFELLAEFNAKVNDEDAPGIDWTSEADRLMVSNMVIKLADINGPCKRKELHVSWTDRITEEFYEQGDEESTLGLPISPYMDRQHPQLAKLQESFINHLVAPLCNAVGGAGLIPGTWVEDDSDEGEGVSTDSDKGDASKDTEEEDTDAESGSTPGHAKKKRSKKIHCWLTKNLKDNHDMWVNVLKQEAAQKERETKKEEQLESITKGEMEPISEEDTPPNSANNLSDDQTNPSPTPDAMGTSQEASGLSPAAASQSLANNTSEVQRTSQTEIPSPCLPRRCPSPLTTPTCTIIQSEPTCSPSSQSEPQVEPANQKDESRIQLTPERCILNKDLASNRSTEV